MYKKVFYFVMKYLSKATVPCVCSSVQTSFLLVYEMEDFSASRK